MLLLPNRFSGKDQQQSSTIIISLMSVQSNNALCNETKLSRIF